MLKQIEVINHRGEHLLLELKNIEKGLFVANIEGLGPGKATISSTSYASTSIQKRTNVKKDPRNIVFTLIHQSDGTVEATRLHTYKFFPIMQEITMNFLTDRGVSTAKGVVESNEVSLFSSQEASQISVMCFDPFFYDAGFDSTIFGGVEPLFEFPFGFEGRDIEFSRLQLDNRVVFNYKGDIETGFLINVRTNGRFKNLQINDIDTDTFLKIDTDRVEQIIGSEILDQDEIFVSTKRGDRYAYLLRDGVRTNIIAAIDINSDWFQLKSGDNTFNFFAEEGEDNLILTFSYKNAYGGI